MKFLPAILLTLTLIARAKSDGELCFPSCGSWGTHEEMVSLLHGIYTEENCSIVEESNGEFTMTCSYDVPGWESSSAEYHSHSCENPSKELSYNPKWFSVSRVSMNGTSSEDTTDLQFGCFDENQVLFHISSYLERPYQFNCGNPSDHHKDVVRTLFNTFGRANCQKTTSTMDCEAKVFGYRASANYEWERLEGSNHPIELTVTTTDLEKGLGSAQTISFDEACVEDSHLSIIQQVLSERSCPNTSRSYAFRDQELTCLELAGERLGKLQRVCTSTNYPDFAEN